MRAGDPGVETSTLAEGPITCTLCNEPFVSEEEAAEGGEECKGVTSEARVPPARSMRWEAEAHVNVGGDVVRFTGRGPTREAAIAELRREVQAYAALGGEPWPATTEER